MKTSIKIIAIFIAMFYIGAGQAKAQQLKTVSGYVMNVGEGRKPMPFKARVRIYACNTMASAQDAMELLNSDNGQISKSIYFDDAAVADKDGYYSIHVMDQGALIILIDMKKRLVEVNGRTEINVNIEGEGIEIPERTIYAFYKDPVIEESEGEVLNDEQINMRCNIPIPQNFGKPNSRLIIQPYVVNCTTNDTVSYLAPIVMNGDEFSRTQERRMGFDIRKDPLNKYTLTQKFDAERKVIHWRDTVSVENTKNNYCGHIIICMEDYTQIYYRKDELAVPCQLRRPLQFLDYTFGIQELNPNNYRQTPRREKRNTTGNVSLRFLIGKAQLDPEEPQNEIQLNKLKEDLMEIVNGDGTTLRQISVTGVASPEGRYTSNQMLAKQRTSFALAQIAATLPAYTRARLTTIQNTRVATWGEVADVLEEDSLNAEANEIREIEKRFSKNRDAQYAAISRLAFYKEHIVPRLPRLRSVHYKYEYDVMRKLNAKEILDRYEHDADYRNGKKSFTLYEYWHLFQSVKNPWELETLYRRAYDDSKSNGDKPWALAANNLAVSYLKRDTFDIEILKPFINNRIATINKESTFVDDFDIIRDTINPEWAVINQIAMYIKAHKYRQADTLATCLPDGVEKYKMSKAFVRCLNGRYRVLDNMDVQTQKKNQETFNLVRSSSPRNEVILLLAMNNEIYDERAQTAAERLPQDEALTFYLKAIIAKRLKQPNSWNSPEEDYLLEAFKRDSKLIAIAANDGDIGEELYDIVMEKYEKEKQQ